MVLAYTEESLAARKQKVRGMAVLRQTETVYVLSQKKLQLPHRPRKNYAGSSSGDLLQGVVLPSLEDEWHVPWLVKKEAYSKKHIINVGGRTDSEDVPPKLGDRLNNGKEPMCYFSAPLELLEEFIHQFYAKLVVDLTPADGKFAYACLKCRVGYVGVAYTEAHAKLLEERLVALLSEAMQDSNSPLFNSAYTQAVTEGSGGKRGPKPRPKPEPRPKPGPKPPKPDGKPKPKPKPKNKGKRGRKGGEDGGNPKKQKTGEQEDGEEEEEEDDELWDPLSG